MGGGPGGPIPYRIYIDGGVVFVCVIALAPQSPLVGKYSAAAKLFFRALFFDLTFSHC